MKVIWAEGAKIDLLESLAYITIDSIKNAEMIRDKIYKAVKLLEEFPNIGVVSKDDILIKMGYRMIVVEKYLIFYIQKNEEEIHITAIKHGAMKYQHLLGNE